MSAAADPQPAAALELPYLVQFALETGTDNLCRFAGPEFEALAQLFGLELSEQDRAAFDQLNIRQNFVQLRLGQADAEPRLREIVSRSVLILKVVRLWSVADSVEELYAINEQLVAPEAAHPRCLEVVDPGFHELRQRRLAETGVEPSLCVNVLNFNGRADAKTRLAWINESCRSSRLMGKVRFEAPETTFDLTVINDTRNRPARFFWGRLLATNDHSWNRWPLKARKMVGPTALPPSLAQIMCNLAQVKPLDLVVDPFLGSGSTMLTAAGLGAVTMGSDFDYKLLYGRTRAGEARIEDNFKQFGLEKRAVDAVISDNSIPVWRSPPGGIWDAIVADPPYGIRAGARQSGTEPHKRAKRIQRALQQRKQPKDGEEKQEEAEEEDEEADEQEGPSEEQLAAMEIPRIDEEAHLRSHTPQSQRYPVEYVISDLLRLAARQLVPGGRLVYLLPTTRSWAGLADLPWHPNLRLERLCEQRIRDWTRWCVTMRRDDRPFQEMTPEDRDASVAKLVEDQERNRQDYLQKIEAKHERLAAARARRLAMEAAQAQQQQGAAAAADDAKMQDDEPEAAREDDGPGPAKRVKH